MNAKQFLIVHGEKVALSATLLACAAQLSVTFGDQSIRPTITPSEIEARNTEIDNVFAQGKPPIMKPVPTYLADMKDRFDRVTPVGTVPSWLTAMPDRGPGTGGLFLYVVELRAPTVTAADAFGKVALTITLPPAIRPDGRRITDRPNATWERSSDGVENHVEHLGILIETHGAGENDWHPLVTKSIPHGFVPRAALNDGTANLTIDGLEPWLRHWFRVRLVAKATSLDLTQPLPAKVTNSVVVVEGQLVGDNDDVPWTEVTEQFKAKDAKLIAKLAKPATPIPGISLAANERLFLGGPSDEAIVQITSDTRFALERVTQNDPNNPGKLEAKFLITKQFTGKDGEKLWLKEPQSFKLGIGDVIGGTAKTENPLRPGMLGQITLTTPFKVVEIKTGQKRIFYWEIREKSRTNGTKGKDLDLQPKTVQTDLVVVENTKSKRQITFTKLAMIKLPTRKESVIYPFHATDVDEGAEFRKDPSAFVEAELSPAEPKPHAPNAGPLTALRAAHPDLTDLYTTDTTYYELADGRIVWWEPLNKQIRQDPEPTVKVDPPAGAGAAPAGPLDDLPKGPQPPVGPVQKEPAPKPPGPGPAPSLPPVRR